MLIKQLTKEYGAKRVWITEYGFQTNPPDRVFGVSYAKQALYLKQAFAIARKNPRIDLMTWFLLRDEPNSRIGNGWQSGLMTAAGQEEAGVHRVRQAAALSGRRDRPDDGAEGRSRRAAPSAPRLVRGTLTLE